MKTSHLTDTITDTIPHAVADTIAEVGSLFDHVPEAVAGGVASGVAGGRRLAHRAADHVPGVPHRSTTHRRKWTGVIVLTLVALAGVVWYTRRSSNQRTDAGQADIADIDARRSVA